MRIVFCGNPEFSIPTLRELQRCHHEIAAVICGPDRPQGRGRKVQPMPVKQFALREGFTVLQPEKLNEADLLTSVRDLNPDALVVVAFRILPRELFAMPPHGSFNVHPSLLPRGRGPAPIQWTLIRGETETGVSIIHLSEVVDGGAILAQERTAIKPDENFGALHDRLAEIGARMLADVLRKFESGTPPQPMIQDEAKVTRAPKLKPEDYRIDWTLPSAEILNRIRAFSPQPGAVTLWNGTVFKILEAQRHARSMPLSAGETKVNLEDGLVVGTATDPLKLNWIQPAGKRPMSVADYLRGRPIVPDYLGK